MAKRVKLSERIKLPEKYKAKTANWLTGIPQHIKVQQQAQRLGRAEEEAALKAPPPSGYGLDGYPLQRGKR